MAVLSTNLTMVSSTATPPGCVFSGRRLAPGYWKEIQWSPTGRGEI